MAEAQLQQFLEKVRQLNAFVALSEAEPALRQELRDCHDHNSVVALARSRGFEIGRRWGENDSPQAGNNNLLASPCPAPGKEVTSVLLEQPSWRLERIHSCQASNPPDFWYDQNEHEWVLLIQGGAEIAFAEDDRVKRLRHGDSLLIPARKRHRLVSTDPAPGSIWLALFWREACCC